MPCVSEWATRPDEIADLAETEPEPALSDEEMQLLAELVEASDLETKTGATES